MAARPLLMLSIALAAASAVVLGACGSDEDVGEIPQDTAAEMRAALDEAQAAQEADPPECDTIADSASTVSNEASQLPESPVRGAVTAAAENLFELANSDECGPTTTGPQGPQDDDETTTTTPVPETTTTEETTTTTTKEEPPAPQPKPKPQPPSEGDEGNGPPGGTPPGQDEGGPDTGGTGGGTGED